MKLPAGKTCVVLAALIAAGSVSASAGRAEDTLPRSPAKTSENDNADARRAVEDAQKAIADARRAAEDAGNRARDIKFQIATPIMADLQFGNPATAKIRQAAEELRDAKDDEAHEKANSKLRDLLDKYFEQDMTHRQKELESIESRLQKLHAQLEHRRAKKQDIIDLQVKMSVNEADGLGFYSQPAGGSFNFIPQPAAGAVSWENGAENGELRAQSADTMPPAPASPAPVPTLDLTPSH
jgi:hypothetical protein